MRKNRQNFKQYTITTKGAKRKRIQQNIKTSEDVIWSISYISQSFINTKYRTVNAILL